MSEAPALPPLSIEPDHVVIAARSLEEGAAWCEATLGATPAMASGLVDHVLKMEDVVFLIDQREGPPKLRGPYKKTAEISN